MRLLLLRAASRRDSLVALIVAGFGVLSPSYTAAEKKHRKHNKRKKGDPNKLCKEQVGQCFDVFSPLCAEDNPECLAILDQCCPVLGNCDLDGFFSCVNEFNR